MTRALSISRTAGLLTLLLATTAGTALAQSESENLPRLKFFYFDSTRIEWVVSSETESFERHLAANSPSQRFVSSLERAALQAEQPDAARANITNWIAGQRQQFDQGLRDVTRFRKAEGVTAYLRAHDFSVRRLVETLRERTGAEAIDLVAVHQVPRPAQSVFRLKVTPVRPALELGREGYNISLQSPEVGYVSVVYALGLALYEVEEIIAANQPAGESTGPSAEELPEPLPGSVPSEPAEPDPAT